MQTVAEAETLISEHTPVYATEVRPLADAQGMVLRDSLVAERDQPPFDRVTMDGIAVAFNAWRNGRRDFQIQATQAAGEPQLSLSNEANCIEIMTGATLPRGTDTIIPVERLRINNGQACVADDYQPQPQQFVHLRGSDRKSGESLLQPGVVIRGPEMALAASAGDAVVTVTRPPGIAVISSGNELVEAGNTLADYQVRSCNDRAIEACLRQRGMTRVTRALLPDDMDVLLSQISALHDDNDVLILSGGVSMGKYDYIPAVMELLAVKLVFYKISQRPGLPMWFGTSGTDKLVFALPGNPVSSLVCLVRYVIPGLQRAMGMIAHERQRVVLAEAIDFEPDLTYFLPVRLTYTENGVAQAWPKPTNTSGDFVSLAGTDGFVELEREVTHFPAGYSAPLFRW